MGEYKLPYLLKKDEVIFVLTEDHFPVVSLVKNMIDVFRQKLHDCKCMFGINIQTKTAEANDLAVIVYGHLVNLSDGDLGKPVRRRP